MEITGFVAIGNGEKCPYCDLIQGKDFEDPMKHFIDNHLRHLHTPYVPRTDVDFEIEKRIVHHKIYDFPLNKQLDYSIGESLLLSSSAHPRYFFEPYGPVPWRISSISMRALRKRYGNYRANRARDRVNAWVNRKAPDELSSYIMAQLEEYEKFGRKGRL